MSPARLKLELKLELNALDLLNALALLRTSEGPAVSPARVKLEVNAFCLPNPEMPFLDDLLDPGENPLVSERSSPREGDVSFPVFPGSG